MTMPHARLLAAALPLALFATTALADAPAAPAAIPAGTYKVETHHTLAEFTVNHLGINDFFGVIPGATGTLSLDPKAPAAAKLDITLPVAGISTTNAVLDGELRAADWFDAAQFPTMHFVSASVVPTGPRSARIEGQLTMHGVTRPLVLEATMAGTGVNPMDKAYTIGFSATGVLKRSDYGVSKGVPFVSDEVRLKISAAFEKTD